MKTFVVTKSFLPPIFSKTPACNAGDRLLCKGDEYELQDPEGTVKGIVDAQAFKKITKKVEGDTLYKEVGLQLRKARMAKGLTIEDLATKIKATRQYLSQLEKGKAACSLSKIEQICDAMGYEFKFKITRKYGQEVVTDATRE